KNKMRFRWAITEAIKYRKTEERTLSEKVALLKADILNGPSHIFGEHKNCSSYFCKDVNTTTSSTLSDIKLT
ncbi:hypothetical protein ILUMI_15942, partial [Ignelater luminosus]